MLSVVVVVVTSWSSHVKEEGEDKACARHCRCHRIIIVACEGGRERP